MTKELKDFTLEDWWNLGFDDYYDKPDGTGPVKRLFKTEDAAEAWFDGIATAGTYHAALKRHP